LWSVAVAAVAVDKGLVVEEALVDTELQRVKVYPLEQNIRLPLAQQGLPQQMQEVEVVDSLLLSVAHRHLRLLPRESYPLAVEVAAAAQQLRPWVGMEVLAEVVQK